MSVTDIGWYNVIMIISHSVFSNKYHTMTNAAAKLYFCDL